MAGERHGGMPGLQKRGVPRSRRAVAREGTTMILNGPGISYTEPDIGAEFVPPLPEHPREAIVKLCEHCTNRLLHRDELLGYEYWSFAEAATDEQAEVLCKMKMRRPYTLPEMVKLTGMPEADIEKMLDDMAMAQLPNGLVPDIAPEYALFREAFRDSPEWGSAFVLVPLYLYEYYGDGTMLRKHYEAMGRYVDYLTSKADDHILKHGLGDWFDIGPKMPGRAQLSSLAATATPIYYMDALAMVKGAELLGKKKDAERWQKLADAIRTSYNEKFFHKEGCYYDRNSQTANSIALCAGLVDPEYRQGVLDNVVKDIRSRNNGLTGGDVGYTYILRALEAGGRSDVIFDMNSRYDVYGYGYMLAQGATALPESWQVVPIKSHNHFMLGHLMQWLYTHVGGIRRDTGALAYKRSVIRPEAVGDLTMARVSFESSYGQIRSEWSKGADGSFELLAEVPANTTSTVWLPAAEDAAVFESNLPVEKVAGIEYLGYKEGCKVYAVGSGTYRFDVRPQR